jgi:hypothetical protein
MTLDELKEIAQQLGITVARTNKSADVIRKIELHLAKAEAEQEVESEPVKPKPKSKKLAK